MTIITEWKKSLWFNSTDYTGGYDSPWKRFSRCAVTHTKLLRPSSLLNKNLCMNKKYKTKGGSQKINGGTIFYWINRKIFPSRYSLDVELLSGLFWKIMGVIIIWGHAVNIRQTDYYSGVWFNNIIHDLKVNIILYVGLYISPWY